MTEPINQEAPAPAPTEEIDSAVATHSTSMNEPINQEAPAPAPTEEIESAVAPEQADLETEQKDDSNVYEFGVTMTCGGCSGAVKRVLGKLDGVIKHEVSLETQTAKVWASPDLSYQAVLGKIHGTNKTVKWGKENDEDRSIEKAPPAIAVA